LIERKKVFIREKGRYGLDVSKGVGRVCSNINKSEDVFQPLRTPLLPVGSFRKDKKNKEKNWNHYLNGKFLTKKEVRHLTMYF
jgi:hypothetical protein